MKVLVVGGSGATGKLLVQQLLLSGHQIKVLVRSSNNLPDFWQENENIEVIVNNITVISVNDLAIYLHDCEAIASCLGHTMSLKGIYGKPSNLVTDTVVKLCKAAAINKPKEPIKFLLMNTAGVVNIDVNEQISFSQKIVLGLIRMLLPPHRDNENAAEYLRANATPFIKWVVIRPDTLLNENVVSNYSLHPSPTTSAIFKPGKTSRINVAHFMSSLIIDHNIWTDWEGKMPVIYNKISV